MLDNLFLTIFTRVYLCLLLITYDYSCLPMFYHFLLVFRVFSCLPMFTLAYQSLSLCTRVYLCLFVLGNLCYPSLLVFTYFYKCWITCFAKFIVFHCLLAFSRVHLCLPLFTCAGLHMFHLYLGLPIFTHVYSCFPMFILV